MKKIYVLALIFAMTISSFVACDLSDKRTETPTFKENEKIYSPVIELYKEMVKEIPYYSNEKTLDGTYAKNFKYDEYEWSERLFDSVFLLCPRELDGIDSNEIYGFGYDIKDLNQDGEDELILVNKNEEIIAIFTQHNDKPVLVESFHHRYRCRIDKDGLIYTRDSNGASHTVNRVCSISAESKELVTLEEYGTDGYNEETLKTIYYRLVDGEKAYITEDEFLNFVNSDGCIVLEDISQFDVLSFNPLYIDYSDINNLPEHYLNVILGKDSFRLDGEEIYINQYSISSLSYDLDSYSVVDMDGDGTVEVLLDSRMGDGDVIMLHYEDEVVYGYSFGFRSMYNVMTDGSFYWNTSAGRQYGAARFSSIDGEGFNYKELYRIEHDAENHDNYKIFIENIDATQEEFDEYQKSLCNEKVTWYKIS